MNLEKSNWRFDENVVPVFDEHVKQSVPMYEEIHNLITDISGWFIEEGSNVYDVGTSTGKVIANHLGNFPSKEVNYIGIDNSKEMVEKAKNTFKDKPNVSLLNEDVTEGFEFKNASITTSVLTNQFIPERKRQDLTNRIYKGLNQGGVYILVEKVIGSNARFNEIWTELYHDLKQKNGLTDSHILEKRKSLRGVMKPFTVQENMKMLNEAGFRDVDMFFKWNNFAGFVAIK